jgi:hypothetical protein
MLASRGFLCRSAYTREHAWVAHVQDVAFGDVLHFYFVDRGPRPVGAFEVIRREAFKIAKDKPTADDFAGPVPGCALYEVIDPSFIVKLDPHGAYQPDPKLQKYTGWLLHKVGPAAAAPAKFLAEQPVLVKR